MQLVLIALLALQGQQEPDHLTLNPSTTDEQFAEKIKGLGKKQANEIRGEVDAEIIREYAQAITHVGEFYTFVRTLEAYENAISEDARLILTTDSEFLGLLKRLGAESKD